MPDTKKIAMENMEYHLQEALFNMKQIYPSFNPRSTHNSDTPKRMAKAFVEMCRGLGDMDFNFTTFPSEGQHNWIVKTGIEFSSLCQHHFMPFFGTVDIAYMPFDTICGLSKLDRVVEYFSKRPQIQERLGDEILQFLNSNLRPIHCLVIVRSLHTCVACRGVESRNSKMTTLHRQGMDSDEQLAIALRLMEVK